MRSQEKSSHQQILKRNRESNLTTLEEPGELEIAEVLGKIKESYNDIKTEYEQQ